MADRETIRDAFYDHLQTEAAGTYDVTASDGSVLHTVTLDAEHVSLYNPEDEETHPQIVYDDSYRQVTYNGVGAGPNSKTYNQDGSVADERWHEYREAQFTIDVRGADELDVEPIYEAVHRAFQKFRYGPWNLSDLHSDISSIEVRSTLTSDVPEADQIIRGDQVEVVLVFKREFILTEDNIDTVDHGVDADNDGTSDDSYTTT